MSTLLEVRDLHVSFPAAGGARLHAVSALSLSLERGQVLGVVGESGCGKSTFARTVMQLQAADRGQILLDGVDLCALEPRALRPHRQKLAMVFQDPFASLNPRFTVEQIIAEPIVAFGRRKGKAQIAERVRELMVLCGLDPAFARAQPHAFSGGQRQRIAIARALAGEPELLVCDEPISALDVSIQAQILNLLRDLQRKLGLAVLFIAHDLAAVRHLCDRVAVMYLGRLVERGSAEAVFERPYHPYTRALLSAVPPPQPERARLALSQALQGEVPSPLNPPTGCAFHPRCLRRQRRPEEADAAGCHRDRPPLSEVGEDQRAACFLPPAGPE